MRVELVKLFGRRRTWVAIGLLNLLPTLVCVLLAWTRIAPRPGQGPAFLSAVIANGSLFAIAALAIVLPAPCGTSWSARSAGPGSSWPSSWPSSCSSSSGS